MNGPLFDKSFFPRLYRLAIPVVLQNLLISSLNLVDVFMVSSLGETAIAAVGLATQVFFLLNLFLFGISSGAAIFTAQFWGKRDVSSIRTVLGLSLISAAGISSFFTVAGLAFPSQILGVYSRDPEVIRLGARFLSLVAVCYIPTAISFCFALQLRSVERPSIPLLASFVGLSLNTFLNWVFIFGKFGLHPMGVTGSALATVIARLVELGMILGVTYGKKLPPAAKIREMLAIPAGFVRRFVKTALPVVFNKGCWAIGVTLNSVIYARMGTEAIAAFNLFGTIEKLSFVLFFGLGQACSVMIGTLIGGQEREKGYGYGRSFLVLGAACAVVVGSLLIVCRGQIISIYGLSAGNIPTALVGAAKNMLLFLGLILWSKVINLLLIVGIFRSGGDTKFSLFLDVGGVWIIGVPAAFLAAFVFKLPVWWVYGFACLEELVKNFIGIPRFLSRKWINDLSHPAASKPLPEAIPDATDTGASGNG